MIHKKKVAQSHFIGASGLGNLNVLVVLDQHKLTPLTPKISLLILSFICDTFPCDLVMRSWFEIKIITSI